MNRIGRALVTSLCVAGMSSAHADAQSSGGAYRVDPVVVANGGGTASGGTFALSGTFGQTATSTLSASGYRFYGGFWAPLGPPSDVIFANGFDP